MCLTIRMRSGEILETQGDLRRFAARLDDWEFRSPQWLRQPFNPHACLCEVNVVVTLNRHGINVRVPREYDVFDFVQV